MNWVIVLMIACISCSEDTSDGVHEDKEIDYAELLNKRLSRPDLQVRVAPTWRLLAEKAASQDTPELKNEYANLIKQRLVAEFGDDPDQQHLIATKFHMLALRGFSVAYLDSIELFTICINTFDHHPNCKWGLGFTYYDLVIDDLAQRKIFAQSRDGLTVPVLDDIAAPRMRTVFDLATSAVQGGYSPPYPDVLEMSADKLNYYCSTHQSASPAVCAGF